MQSIRNAGSDRAVAKAALPPVYTLSAVERAGCTRRRARRSAAGPQVGEVRDLAAGGPAGRFPCGVSRPGYGSRRAAAVLVYSTAAADHRDLDTHHIVSARSPTRRAAGCVAVDYRMGPEHKFPAAVDDSVAATRWVAEHGAALGVDAAALLSRDSAGGNLATVVAITLRTPAGRRSRSRRWCIPRPTSA